MPLKVAMDVPDGTTVQAGDVIVTAKGGFLQGSDEDLALVAEALTLAIETVEAPAPPPEKPVAKANGPKE